VRNDLEMGNYIGIIDLGSNTVRLAVYYRDELGVMYEFDNIKRVLRLISHVQQDGTLDADGFRITLDCLRQFKELCDAREVSEIIGVATAGVRQAVNGQQLLEAIERETGIRVRLLSGEEEAYYGYLAVVNSMSLRDGYSIDIGGASTEITYIQNRGRVASFSFPFGVVTLTKKFLLHDIPESQELRALDAFLSEQFASQPWIRASGCPVIALGGTARNVAKVSQRRKGYTLASLHQYVIQRAEVDAIYGEVSRGGIEVRKSMEGLSSDRADIIVAGVAVFRVLMSRVVTEQLITSNKGLRDGILFEKMFHKAGTAPIADVAESSARQFMIRYHVNQAHALHVRQLATELFDGFQQLKILTLGPTERKILGIAAMLHDIGRSINAYESSQHTFYLLSNVLLMGITHRERMMIAMVASYKNSKQLLSQLAAHQDIVEKTDKDTAEQLGLLVLAARTLDRSMTHQVTNVKVRHEKKRVVLECTGDKSDLVEYALLEEVMKRFAKVFKRKFGFCAKTKRIPTVNIAGSTTE